MAVHGGRGAPADHWLSDRPGWLRQARHFASPNYDQRPAGTRVDLLVVHHISLPPGYFAGDAVPRLFCNTLDCNAHPSFAQLQGLRVSSHFLISRHGGISQFVDIHQRAWHAGQSRFRRRTNCNNFSVGIEMQGDGQRPFTNSQYRSLLRLTERLRAVLPLRFVAGHSDIAPGRKFDPGPTFDWCQFLGQPQTEGLVRPQKGR